MTVSEQALAKADHLLREALTSRSPDADEPLPVMIMLRPAGAETAQPPPDRAARQSWARAREAEFERETEALVAELESTGARAIRRHWVGRSLSGELPPTALDAAARHAEVVRLALVVPRNVLL